MAPVGARHHTAIGKEFRDVVRSAHTHALLHRQHAQVQQQTHAQCRKAHTLVGLQECVAQHADLCGAQRPEWRCQRGVTWCTQVTAGQHSVERGGEHVVARPERSSPPAAAAVCVVRAAVPAAGVAPVGVRRQWRQQHKTKDVLQDIGVQRHETVGNS